MHGVMKLASQVAPDSSSIQSLAFSLLANLAISRDCRGALLKVTHWPMFKQDNSGETSIEPLESVNNRVENFWLQIHFLVS